MKWRSAVLIVVNVVNAALLSALMATGALLEWVLPPGQGRLGFGRGFLGLSRHEWGGVHFWIACGFVASVVVHLALHGGWMRAMAGKAERWVMAEPRCGGSRERVSS